MYQAVFNPDMAGMYHRTDDYMMELGLSTSSDTADFDAGDRQRALDYINELRNYHDHIVSEPTVDNVEETNEMYDLREPFQIPDTQSQQMTDLLREFSRVRHGIANCPSTRKASGMISHDSKRFTDGLDRIERFITEYVDHQSPVDLPRTTPRAKMVNSGRTGVTPRATNGVAVKRT